MRYNEGSKILKRKNKLKNFVDIKFCYFHVFIFINRIINTKLELLYNIK